MILVVVTSLSTWVGDQLYSITASSRSKGYQRRDEFVWRTERILRNVEPYALAARDILVLSCV